MVQTQVCLTVVTVFIVYSYTVMLNCSALLWENNSDHSYRKIFFLAESRRILTVNNRVLCCAS